jgi:hypothetical protein
MGRPRGFSHLFDAPTSAGNGEPPSTVSESSLTGSVHKSPFGGDVIPVANLVMAGYVRGQISVPGFGHQKSSPLRADVLF